MNAQLIASIIVALIGAAGSIIAVVITARNTQDKVQNELKTANEVQNVKLDRLQADMDETKRDQKEMQKSIAEHNKYGALFNEAIPEIKHRLDRLEARN